MQADPKFLVRIWVYDGVLASGIAGPIDVLNAANAVHAEGRGAGAEPLFAWRVESMDGKQVRSASGQWVSVDGRLQTAAKTAAVVVTGPYVGDVCAFLEDRDRLEPLLAGIRRQYESGTLVASYCSGSFLLAEAGLLDGRAATTHWAKASEFRRRYPAVALRAGDVLVEDDRILCSGAVTSYLQMALRIVARFGGERLADETARLLLVDTSRVSQAAYAVRDLASEHSHADPLVARAQRWLERHLHEPVRLHLLAAQLAVTERTLHRRFRAATGQAPLGYLQALRVAAAQRLLQQRHRSVEDIAARVGYGDVGAFRAVFRRHTGLTPAAYQAQFSRPRYRRGVPVQAPPPSVTARKTASA